MADHFIVERYSGNIPHKIKRQALDIVGTSFCGTDSTIPEGLSDWFYDDKRENMYGTLPSPPTEKRLQFCLDITGAYGFTLLRHGAEILLCRNGKGDVAGCCIIVRSNNSLPKDVTTQILSCFGNMEMYWVWMYDLGYFPPRPLKYKYEHQDEMLKRFQKFEEVVEEMHDKLVGDKNHIYMPFLAVKPSFQGQGVGKTLIQEVLNTRGEEKFPVIFESAGKRNRQVYEKLGAKVLEKRVFGIGESTFDSDGGLSFMMFS